MPVPLRVPAITATTAATSIELPAGFDIHAFVVDNRSGATLYISFNGARDAFEAVWPGDIRRFVVRQDSIRSIWIYASAATAEGQVMVEVEPKPMYSG